MALLENYARLTVLPLGIATLTVTYYVSLAIYRLYFHPLAKFPGPRLNAVSGIPAIISLLKGRMPMDNKVLHDTYGRIVRVSPNEISFDSQAAWEDIYGHRNSYTSLQKDPVHVGSISTLRGATPITMSNRYDHPRQRRAFSHAFSQKALVEQEDMLQEHVTKLISNFHRIEQRKETVNLANWFNFTTFDMIGDLSFGEPFGCGFHFWVLATIQAIKYGAWEQATRRVAPTGTLLNNLLLRLIPSDLAERRAGHFEYSKETTTRRLETETKRRDFIWYTLRQKEKNEISLDEILVNSALFIVAGSDTTASLMSGLMAYLIRNKHSYDTLVAEIRNSFPSEDQLRDENLSRLPYFNACVEEGLRIFPPVPLGLMRVIPEGGDTVDGYFLEANTQVSCSAYISGWSERNFRSAAEFIPERWIDSAYKSDNKKATYPFSLGPRGCIGRNLAALEIRIIIARLLWNFDIVWADQSGMWEPSGEMKNMRANLTWDKPDLEVKLVSVKR